MGKKEFCIGILMMILCLTACGRQENAVVQNDFSGHESAAMQDSPSPLDSDLLEDSVVMQEERQGHDWRTEDWQIGDKAEWDGQLYAGEYIYGLESSPERAYTNRYIDYRTWGNKFYALEEYSTVEGEAFYYMSSFDSFTGEILHQSLEIPCPEEYAGCEVRLANFDIQTEQEWVFFLQIWPDEKLEEPIAYLAVHLSPEGELLSQVDLFPVIKEYCGRLYHHLYNNIYMDQQGYYYLRLVQWPDPSIGGGGEIPDPICVLDPEGRLVKEMRPPSGEYPNFSTKTPDGTPIFNWYLNGTYFWMMYYDQASQQPREVMKKRGNKNDWTGISCWVGMLTEDGYLYFLDNSMRLSRCDLYTGKRDYCLGYGKLGLGSMRAYIYMVPGPEGAPVILDTMDENGAVICRLTRQEPETEPIRLVSLTENCTLIENQALLFSKEHMDHPIEVEMPSGNAEEYRTRILAELVSGKGADIYYVSAEDMQILYKNGVLADLTGILSPEVEAAIYPGVLEGGMIQGHRVGLAPEARPRTMIVSGQYGDHEQWTLEELMNLVDAHPELRYPVIYAEGYMDGYRLLRLLLCQDMDNTPFLDLENGSCDFENPLFVRILELAGRYQENPIEITMDTNAARDLMEERACMAVIIEPYGFPHFSDDMTILGEDYRAVGFPGDKGGLSYWRPDYYLVVNKAAQYPELAYSYLQSLFGEKCQDGTLYAVRRGLLEKHIIEVEGDEVYPLRYSAGNGGYYYLDTKPDGSSWQEEYEAIREQCVMASGNIDAIETIIIDEAAGYFDHTREADAVAALIQNRVQLYLDEQWSAPSEPLKGKGGGNRTGGRNGA